MIVLIKLLPPFIDGQHVAIYLEVSRYSETVP